MATEESLTRLKWAEPPAERAADLLPVVAKERVPTQRAKLILTDVDNTILNFSKGFDAWMTARSFRKRGDTADQYSLSAAYGLKPKQIAVLIEQFCASPEGADLEPHPCARDALPILYRAGWRFVAISSCPNFRGFEKRRRANLREAFGFDFTEVRCLGLGADKRGALRSYRPSVWIEDHTQNAARGAQAGHRTFLLDRPYNRADAMPPGVSRVSTWDEIVHALTDGRVLTNVL